MGTQDLGIGTRTAILIVAGDTLGLHLNQIELKIGDNQYPQSGGSGGSTTIGGVSSSTRRAAVDAREQLFAKVASALQAQAGRPGSRGRKHSREIGAFAQHDVERCMRASGHAAHSGAGQNPGGREDLISSGVGGAVMADVSVDTETGIVKMNKMVCVQDCGLIISMKTAESQV